MHDCKHPEARQGLLASTLKLLLRGAWCTCADGLGLSTEPRPALAFFARGKQIPPSGVASERL